MKASPTTKDYTHELHTEVRSISGGYELQEEGEIEIEGRIVLYAVGNAAVDSACCGTYGCYFALVAGYLVRRHYRTNDAGIPVSEVEPIRGRQARYKIGSVLSTLKRVTQVQFW